MVVFCRSGKFTTASCLIRRFQKSEQSKHVLGAEELLQGGPKGSERSGPWRFQGWLWILPGKFTKTSCLIRRFRKSELSKADPERETFVRNFSAQKWEGAKFKTHERSKHTSLYRS